MRSGCGKRRILRGEHDFFTQQLQALGAGQTHLLVTGYYQPRKGTVADARAVLADVYHGLFSGLARVQGVAATVQEG